MARDRRRANRIPVSFYVDQIIDESIHRSFTTSLSVTGLFTEAIASPLGRYPTHVQLELPLPGERDTLWARAEIVHEKSGPIFHGTALRFTTMANRHRRWLGEWIQETRRSIFAPEIVHAGPIAIIRPS